MKMYQVRMSAVEIEPDAGGVKLRTLTDTPLDDCDTEDGAVARLTELAEVVRAHRKAERSGGADVAGGLLKQLLEYSDGGSHMSLTQFLSPGGMDTAFTAMLRAAVAGDVMGRAAEAQALAAFRSTLEEVKTRVDWMLERSGKT